MNNQHEVPIDDEELRGWPVWRATKQRAVTGDFTDLIIECGDQEFKVHKLVMAASGFFARACLAPFKESQEGVIRLPDDEPEAVKAMIEYMYHGRYGKDLLPQAEPCAEDCVCHRPIEILSDSDSDATSSEGSASDSSDEDAPMALTRGESADERSRKSSTPPEKCNKEIAAEVACMELPLDAKVYALGDKYGLPEMKYIALQNFDDAVGASPGHVVKEPFRQAVIIAYSSTPDEDVMLKKTIAGAISLYKQAARSAQVEILLQEIPQLNIDVNLALFKVVDEMRNKVEQQDNMINMLKAKSAQQLAKSRAGTKRKR